MEEGEPYRGVGRIREGRRGVRGTRRGLGRRGGGRRERGEQRGE